MTRCDDWAWQQEEQGRKLPRVNPAKLDMAEHNRQYDVHSVFADDGRHAKRRAPPQPRVKPPQPPPQQPPRADAKVSKKAHLMQEAHDMEQEAQRQAAELERCVETSPPFPSLRCEPSRRGGVRCALSARPWAWGGGAQAGYARRQHGAGAEGVEDVRRYHPDEARGADGGRRRRIRLAED